MFFEILILGFSIERFINLSILYIDKYFDKINNSKIILSIFLSLIIAIIFRINLIPSLNIFGIIISGLIISGISNFISEIMKIFKNISDVTGITKKTSGEITINLQHFISKNKI